MAQGPRPVYVRELVRVATRWPTRLHVNVEKPLTFKGFWFQFRRMLKHPEAFGSASRKLGIKAALKLVRIRLGSRRTVYELRVPQWPHPVYVRGGTSSDAIVLYEILVTGEYDLIGKLDSARFIIDGGANIGLASLHLLNRFPGARIVAVEPAKESAELCRRNLAAYSDRATVLQGAIWSANGNLILEPSAEEWTARVRHARAGESGSVRAFAMTSLLTLGRASELDLLKLDVEGSEREIFGLGAQDWLPAVRNIVVELHGRDCDELFFSAMASFDFEMTRQDSVVMCRNIRLRSQVRTA